MVSDFEPLKHFIEDNGIKCAECKHFNKDTWDCEKKDLARKVTNKFDFGTFYVFPIASAVRTLGGKCTPDGKHFEK